MKINWTGTTYSGTREWVLALGRGKGAEHWLWSGGSSIAFGAWGGDKINSPTYTYDISTCDYLATTYESGSGLYVLYCDDEAVAQRTIKNGDFDIKDTLVRIGISVGSDASNNDFSGCVERVLIYREALTEDEVRQVIAEQSPTAQPTDEPTRKPTAQPTTAQPTDEPTLKPTAKPTTAQPTDEPTLKPTAQPSTASPTVKPTAEPTHGCPYHVPGDITGDTAGEWSGSVRHLSMLVASTPRPRRGSPVGARAAR